jgi:DNA-directed RNA polymerase subunit RPC12/RpoP
MPYFRCPECDSIFHTDEESRYIWCTGCGMPLDVMHQVPSLPAPERTGPHAAERTEKPQIRGDDASEGAMPDEAVLPDEVVAAKSATVERFKRS